MRTSLLLMLSVATAIAASPAPVPPRGDGERCVYVDPISVGAVTVWPGGKYCLPWP